MTFTNETGTFTVDDSGVLREYRSSEANQVSEKVWRCVDIPEGVRVIPEWGFRECRILERLTLPASLRVISTGGAGAFSWSSLPHVELPDTLKELGPYAFGGSEMRALRIPKGLHSIYNRQFKESSIGTLYLPEGFWAEGSRFGFCEQPKSWEEHEKRTQEYGYINSILANNVTIGEVIVESRTQGFEKQEP